MTLYVVPIVEGQTEAGCVERLLQRIWTELLAVPTRLQVLAPSRGKRDALVNPARTDLADKIEEAVTKLNRHLRRDAGGRGLLLVLLDAEGDCPKDLAPRLLRTARLVRSDTDVACVLAKRMFENWIVAGASTLAGVNGLPKPLQPPKNPEDCHGAARLERQLRRQKRSRPYKKTVDAPVFVGGMSLEQCRAHSPSFDKLCRELALRQLPPAPAADTGPTLPAS